MSKFMRAMSVIAALAVVGAIVAQNRANSNTQTNGQNAKATASSSADSSHNGSANVGPWRDPSKEVYVIRYSPGPTWKQGKNYYEQPLQKHAEFMAELQKRNILLLDGPFKDNTGEEAVIQVNNEAEAMDVVAADPAVIMLVMTAELKPWHLAFENTGRVTFGGNSSRSGGSSGPGVKSSSGGGG